MAKLKSKELQNAEDLMVALKARGMEIVQASYKQLDIIRLAKDQIQWQKYQMFKAYNQLQALALAEDDIEHQIVQADIAISGILKNEPTRVKRESVEDEIARLQSRLLTLQSQQGK